MTIHAAAVLIMAFAGARIRVQLEARRLHQWTLIAMQIFATALIGLLMAVLHGIECGIWAAVYLWVAALDSPTEALLYSVGSMATPRRIRANAATTLAGDGRSGGGRRAEAILRGQG